MSHFSDAVLEVNPTFNKERLMADIFNKNFNNLELKERMRHFTLNLGNHLPNNFSESIEILMQAKEALDKKDLKLIGLELIFLPDYIEVFGLDEYEKSISAMEIITTYVSCEFAIRPFIIKYPEPSIKTLIRWSKHKNQHLRRLASEGCRPRLPWAMALPEFKKDPSPILTILENLKNDSSEYVRRSVANNLNDIAKDNPDITLSIVKKWQGKSKETDSLIKHAMRSLLKSNYPGAMQLFGYGDSKDLLFSGFKIASKKIKVGEHLNFSFSIKNNEQEASKVRIEYAIHFLLANGKISKKVFKISERKLPSGEEIHVRRKHSFGIITTRKYYSGQHFVSIILNGKDQGAKEFFLQ